VVYYVTLDLSTFSIRVGNIGRNFFKSHVTAGQQCGRRSPPGLVVVICTASSSNDVIAVYSTLVPHGVAVSLWLPVAL
jgi:hypothetical protein